LVSDTDRLTTLGVTTSVGPTENFPVPPPDNFRGGTTSRRVKYPHPCPTPGGGPQFSVGRGGEKGVYIVNGGRSGRAHGEGAVGEAGGAGGGDAAAAAGRRPPRGGGGRGRAAARAVGAGPRAPAPAPAPGPVTHHPPDPGEPAFPLTRHPFGQPACNWYCTPEPFFTTPNFRAQKEVFCPKRSGLKGWAGSHSIVKQHRPPLRRWGCLRPQGKVRRVNREDWWVGVHNRGTEDAKLFGACIIGMPA